MSVPAIPSFKKVRKILNTLVAGRREHLKEIHGEGFGWKTNQQLQDAFVHPGGKTVYRLIDPDLAQKGQGDETNLIKALVKGVGNFPRMPKSGPYATQAQIDTIVAWINGGMPD
jgi:hypothetical protein